MSVPKLALAVAPEKALPSAFVVFREPFSSSLRKAAAFGYDGVELALLDRTQVDMAELKVLLAETGLAVPMVSTGQVFADAGDSFASADPDIRSRAERRFAGLMEIASELGALINVGRVRGSIAGNGCLSEVESRVAEILERLARRGETLGVGIVIEPVNRYEIDFLNSLDETVSFLDRHDLDSVGLMPDLFHMNIEDDDAAAALRRYAGRVEYVHFADSNRNAPGSGHMDFLSPLAALRETGFSGWIALEIFPRPDADSAAEMGARAMKSLLDESFGRKPRGFDLRIEEGDFAEAAASLDKAGVRWTTSLRKGI